MRSLKPEKIASGLTAAKSKKQKMIKGKRVKNKGLVLGETEANVGVAIGRVVPATARRTQADPLAAPGTAAQHTAFTIAAILLFPS